MGSMGQVIEIGIKRAESPLFLFIGFMVKGCAPMKQVIDHQSGITTFVVLKYALIVPTSMTVHNQVV